TFYQHTLQQSALHDALLYSALRFCAQSSLPSAAHFLHRPPHLRASYPHIRLHRDHADRARDNRPQPHGSRSGRGLDYRAPLDRVRNANFLVNPPRLSARLVYQHCQIFHWRFCLFDGDLSRADCDIFYYARPTMIKKILTAILFVLFGTAAAFAAPHLIAFERKDAVWIANIDGTGEKKIVDGIFPAISPDGTRVAFNTVEKMSDTTYVRHIAVVDVATGKIDVFKDVPSDNSYYPSWTADGKQILFTTRPHEVWDLVTANADGTNFHVLKPGVQNEVTRYSPIWARDGQSVFCEDMANVYQLGLDGAVRAQWKIGK